MDHLKSPRESVGDSAGSRVFSSLGWGPIPVEENHPETTGNNRSQLPGYENPLDEMYLCTLDLYGQQIPAGTYPHLQRGAAVTKEIKRAIPRPVVIVMEVNKRPARALIDSGSLSDSMSVTLAEQLKLKKTELTKPLVVQLAVQGSRSKVNYGARVLLKYQAISEDRYFDVINLQNYDLVLGTPFLFQHKILVGFNPPRVVIGSASPLPMKGAEVTTLESRVATVVPDDLEETRDYLKKLAKPLCTKASETNLPPLRAINHTIPLIDENKIYPWRPSRCPEPLRPQWAEKRRSYLASGRWQVTSAGNTVPMLFIRKPGSDK
ncbi:hypothetical protein BDR04DRAFT_1208224, partial [Suillus decipiens]